MKHAADVSISRVVSLDVNENQYSGMNMRRHGKYRALLIRLLGSVAVLFPISATATDPFYSGEDWKIYQNLVIDGREHELPDTARSSPGSSPPVAMQTLVLSDYSVKEVSVPDALNQFVTMCTSQGMRLSLFVDPALATQGVTVSYSARNQTAQEVFSNLLGLCRASVCLSGSNLLVGHFTKWGLNPRAAGYKTWIVSDSLHRAWFDERDQSPNQLKTDWIGVERILSGKGVPFPVGSFADYRSDTHTLVVVNTFETLNSLAELFKEREAEFVVKSASAKGRVQIEDYELVLRIFPITEIQANSLHGQLISKGALVPFALASESFFIRAGVGNPRGSAVWLDVKDHKLWILNTPDRLDLCSKLLSLPFEDFLKRELR